MEDVWQEQVTKISTRPERLSIFVSLYLQLDSSFKHISRHKPFVTTLHRRKARDADPVRRLFKGRPIQQVCGFCLCRWRGFVQPRAGSRGLSREVSDSFSGCRLALVWGKKMSELLLSSTKKQREVLTQT